MSICEQTRSTSPLIIFVYFAQGWSGFLELSKLMCTLSLKVISPSILHSIFFWRDIQIYDISIVLMKYSKESFRRSTVRNILQYHEIFYFMKSVKWLLYIDHDVGLTRRRDPMYNNEYLASICNLYRVSRNIAIFHRKNLISQKRGNFTQNLTRISSWMQKWNK